MYSGDYGLVLSQTGSGYSWRTHAAAPDWHREFHHLFIETRYDEAHHAMLATKVLWELPGEKGPISIAIGPTWPSTVPLSHQLAAMVTRRLFWVAMVGWQCRAPCATAVLTAVTIYLRIRILKRF